VFLLIEVLVTDDHPMVRQGLISFLESSDNITVVAEAATGEEAIAKAIEYKPDVVLMDIVLPGIDGVEATKRILKVCRHTAVVMLSSYIDEEKIAQALQVGAVGYLQKDISPVELIKAIEAVSKGQTFLQVDLVRIVLAAKQEQEKIQRDLESLTSRELEVLKAIGEGKSNKEIAEILYISDRTVKTHVSNILHKLGLEHRTQAAIYAVKENIVR